MDSSFLPLVQKPSRYLGNELNAVRPPRNGKTVHVGMAFPDLYEIGMSHLGLGLLYHCLNRTPGITAERVFLPAMDLQALLRERDTPLSTLESQTPLSSLDVLGFTLAYELTFTNVLAMLDLGNIPLRSAERGREHPLVIAGGPCAFNPEPLSAFIDAFVIGEAEFRLPEICALVAEWKASGDSRETLLEALDHEEGVYVPSRFDRRLDPDGKTWRMVPTGDRTGPVVKCSVLDLENAPYPDNPVIPFSRIVHDRISIEAARGCPHACRFCQASVLYRPYRERTPARVLDLALENLKNTGYGDLSLLSLSIGDYTGLLPLASMLMEKTQPCKVALSLPSIRVGSLDDSVVEEILRVRKTGFTLAPEAATVRLRSVINKNIDEEDLVRAAHFLATRGWRSLKLYFMIGLPTEREEDVEAIVRLAETIQKNARIARSGPFTVTVNVSTFVPKAHTPFQWERQLSREEAEEKQRFLRKKLRKPGFKIKWHDARQSLLEGLFARGDRTLCDLLETAYKLGCGLDGWNEHFRYDLWEEAFSAVSVNPEDFLQPHPGPETPLPWDWIDAGVHRDFLVREYRKAHREESTAFRCRGDCTRCNLCSSRSDTPAAPAETTPAAAKPETDAHIPGSTTRVHVLPPRVAPARRIRLTYWKTGRCILLSHLETVNVLYRALRRSTLPICYTEGEHPQPRVSFSPALPVGVESHAEILDLWIHESLDRETVKARLNAVLPEGFSVVSAREVSLSAPSVEESITWVAYDILFTEDALWRPGPEELTLALEEFSTGLRQPAPAKGKKRKSTSRPEIRHAVTLEIFGENDGLHCKVHKLTGSLPSPLRILSALFPEQDPRVLNIHIRKKETAFLAYLPKAKRPVDKEDPVPKDAGRKE